MAQGEPSLASNEAAGRVMGAVEGHPHFEAVRALGCDTRSLRVEATALVPMAQRLIATGGTQEGVRPKETLVLDFPGPEFGQFAPAVWLRADFPTHLAHIQPWKGPDNQVIPCFLDGDPHELLHARGLGSVLDQIIAWLESAAEGKLINPQQGWEPTRRDEAHGQFIADESRLAGSVNPKSGTGLFGLQFFEVHADDGEWVQATLIHERVPFTSSAYESLCCRQYKDIIFGKGLCLVVWGGARKGTSDTYRPEWVNNFGDLKKRAEEFHCLSELEGAIKRLERARNSFSATDDRQTDFRIPLVVVLVARRPFPLIGSTHRLEIIAYRMPLGHGVMLPFDDGLQVKPLVHRQMVSRSLLRRLSGLQEDLPRPEWTLVGAGSLGSKIGVSLARRGDGPKAVVDKGRLSPHHMARHGLLPKADTPEEFVEGYKAERLSKAISALGQPCKSVCRDARDLLEGGNLPWRRRDQALVNTTASLAVRHALCRSEVHGLPRIIEAALFAEGAIGVLAIESVDRSILITDLFETLRVKAAANERLGDLLLSDGDGLSRVIIGHGCGSMTMAASDTSISILAAAMAEELAGVIAENSADHARLVIFDRSEPSVGMARKEIVHGPVVVLENIHAKGWSFRLHEQAAERIDEDIARWSGVETGGVLIGRRCDFTRQVHIVDALIGPEDSQRSRDSFVLGVRGRSAAITARTRGLGPSYVALGTWHNHHVESPPSPTDLAMARKLFSTSGISPVCLIRSPGGWRIFSSSLGES